MHNVDDIKFLSSIFYNPRIKCCAEFQFILRKELTSCLNFLMSLAVICENFTFVECNVFER